MLPYNRTVEVFNGLGFSEKSRYAFISDPIGNESTTRHLSVYDTVTGRLVWTSTEESFETLLGLSAAQFSQALFIQEPTTRAIRIAYWYALAGDTSDLQIGTVPVTFDRASGTISFGAPLNFADAGRYLRTPLQEGRVSWLGDSIYWEAPSGNSVQYNATTGKVTNAAVNQQNTLLRFRLGRAAVRAVNIGTRQVQFIGSRGQLGMISFSQPMAAMAVESIGATLAECVFNFFFSGQDGTHLLYRIGGDARVLGAPALVQDVFPVLDYLDTSTPDQRIMPMATLNDVERAVPDETMLVRAGKMVLRPPDTLFDATGAVAQSRPRILLTEAVATRVHDNILTSRTPVRFSYGDTTYELHSFEQSSAEAFDMQLRTIGIE